MQAKWEVRCPVAAASCDGTTSRRYARAPAAEGDGAELPALLGLQSMQTNNGVAETGVGQKRPTFPGKGGHEITRSPGVVYLDLASAPSGHLCAPVDVLE